MLNRWNTASFKPAVLSSDRPVLVDFYADWCGPCRNQLPVVEALAAELGDRASIGKVNVDENPELASLFRVSSIPTLLLFREGRLSKRYVGLTGAAELRAELLSAEQPER